LNYSPVQISLLLYGVVNNLSMVFIFLIVFFYAFFIHIMIFQY